MEFAESSIWIPVPFLNFPTRGIDALGKKYDQAAKLIDKPAYTLEEAMPLIKKAAFAKFDETV